MFIALTTRICKWYEAELNFLLGARCSRMECALSGSSQLPGSFFQPQPSTCGSLLEKSLLNCIPRRRKVRAEGCRSSCWGDHLPQRPLVERDRCREGQRAQAKNDLGVRTASQRFAAVSKSMQNRIARHAKLKQTMPRGMGRDQGVTEKQKNVELAVLDAAPSRLVAKNGSRSENESPETEALLLGDDEEKGKKREKTAYARLWSNVNEGTLKHEPGSLVGASLLVAGTTVGAGILAIPAVTQEAGFLASAFACVGCWAYMATTGILVAEVNVNTMCELGSGGVSLVSMAERTLGKAGVRIAVGTYIFIHYALLVAYVARSGDIITNSTGLPLPVSAAAFTALFGAITYFSSQKTLGYINGLLIAAILASFATLVGIAAPEVEPAALLKANWAAVPASIPIVALSFVYQNVVPVISSELEGDLPKIRTAIVYGTAIPLVMFLLWDAVILGSVPAADSAAGAAAQSMAAMDPLLRLRESSGAVGPAVEVFSFFAIGTSFIGFVLGLSDFLADLLKLPSGQEKRQPVPYLLTLLPPYALALTNPEIFYKALDFAGAYGVLVLFGLLPGAMAWSERYSDTCAPPAVKPVVPGGKVTLALLMGAAGVVIAGEFGKDLAGFLHLQ